MTKIIDWDGKGDALQGDVVLFRVPDGLKISTAKEISPRDGRLVLAEGEVTGHHHAIWMKHLSVAYFHDEALAREMVTPTAAPVATAKLYRDASAVQALVSDKELTTDTLAIGFLIVEGGPVSLTHDEHDGIRIPVGRYYVGGQREWDAAAERRVQD